MPAGDRSNMNGSGPPDFVSTSTNSAGNDNYIFQDDDPQQQTATKSERERLHPVTPYLHIVPDSSGVVSGRRSSGSILLSAEDQLAQAREQISQEKAGKRKLFHSLVKLANQLRKTQSNSYHLTERERFKDRHWYEGGLWRAPTVLPGVTVAHGQKKTSGLISSASVSLSGLFLSIVTVIAFTRVGAVISRNGYVDSNNLLYFALFWCIWGKEVSYSTRFDTSDLSAQVVQLLTCLAVLFASLSVQAPICSIDGSRIMLCAAFVAILHCLLHIRLVTSFWCNKTDMMDEPEVALLARRCRNYATFIVTMTALEATAWLAGVFYFPEDWEYRRSIFLLGVILSLRIPRAFLANDFHAACSQRGVLFILLLGFSLQRVLAVAGESFLYETPSVEQYCFIGAACLLLFSIKLLYIEDSDTTSALDHALLLNRAAAFFFNIGHFALLLSTTILGAGLSLLTHDYIGTTSSFNSPTAKTLICGGFSVTLLSTFLIKSTHLRRIPNDRLHHSLFFAAYTVQAVVLLLVVVITGIMASFNTGGVLENLKNSDIWLLSSLSCAALLNVILGWADEGLELALYDSSEEASEFRVLPFAFCSCWKPPPADDDSSNSVQEPSVVSSLLGPSSNHKGYSSVSGV